jgi:hypothetical protein
MPGTLVHRSHLPVAMFPYKVLYFSLLTYDSLVGRYRHFKGIYYLHLQGRLYCRSGGERDPICHGMGTGWVPALERTNMADQKEEGASAHVQKLCSWMTTTK